MPKLVSDKMRIKKGMRAIFVEAPEEAIAAMRLPPLSVSSNLSGKFDYVHLFVRRRAELERTLPGLKKHLAPGGKLWVSWPKSGQLGTDLKLEAVIRAGYGNGLVESTCLSINAIWSGLRFTWPIPGKTYHNSHAVLRTGD